MNPLLLGAAGGLVAYLFLRDRPSAAAAAAPPSMSPAANPAAPPRPVPASPAPASSGAKQPGAIIASPSPSAGETRPPASMPPPALSGLRGWWAWPVLRWQDRAPVITNPFAPNHRGVDLMFARIASDPYPVGSPNGTKSFVMPDRWLALAAADGLLWSAEDTPRGKAIVIDHGEVATFYTHLETLLVPAIAAPAAGEPAHAIPIKAGQPIGVIGADPLDAEGIKHLHFELWDGGPDKAIDPKPYMGTWSVYSAADISRFLPADFRNAKRPARPAPTTYRTKNDPKRELVAVDGYERRWPHRALHWES